MNAFGRFRVLSVLAATLSCIAPGAHTQATDTTGRITGIAHVAIRVADLDKSRAFYKALGFTEPFSIIAKDGKVTEVFVKINDHQYIELYPSDPTHAPGFQHVCWEAVNIEGLYQQLTAHGVVAPPVRTAGAGNKLIAWKEPTGQTIEITEYMPGSRHSDDFGKDLGPDRIAGTLEGAIVPVPDTQALITYLRDKMSFRIEPGPSGAKLAEPLASPKSFIGLTPVTPAAPPSILVFRVASVTAAKKALQARGLTATAAGHDITTKDPDGNLVDFNASAQ